MPTTSSLTVGVLGPVTAWIEGDEVALGPPRQRALVAVLALPPILR
jgi:DNA-binding SARP family transcriptional activator